MPRLGVREATFYTWERTYTHVGVSEPRRLLQVEMRIPALDGWWLDCRPISLCRPRPCEKESDARPPP